MKLHNVSCNDVADGFPETLRLVERIPGLYPHVFFSSMAPNTHIVAHHGPTNKKLRIHLPIIVPQGAEDGLCRLRVGDVVHTFRQDELLIFDDSFEHEAFNEHSDLARVCLIVDIWHPDFSEREVKLMSFLEKGKLRRAKTMCDRARESHDHDDADNFYALLERGKSVEVKADEILGSE